MTLSKFVPRKEQSFEQLKISALVFSLLRQQKKILYYIKISRGFFLHHLKNFMFTLTNSISAFVASEIPPPQRYSESCLNSICCHDKNQLFCHFTFTPTISAIICKMWAIFYEKLVTPHYIAMLVRGADIFVLWCPVLFSCHICSRMKNLLCLTGI